MLKRIQIKNFRSCQNVELNNLGNITALVGRNGSGKTNILRAIEWFARSATSTDFALVVQPRHFLSGRPREISAEIQLNETLYRITFAVVPKFSHAQQGEQFSLVLQEIITFKPSTGKWLTMVDRTGDQIDTASSGRIKTGHLTPALQALTALLPEESEHYEHLKLLQSFLSKIRYYPIDESNDVAGVDGGYLSQLEYRDWLAEMPNQPCNSRSIVLRLIHIVLNKKKIHSELIALLGPRGLNLLSEIRVDKFVSPISANGNQEDGGRVFYHLRFKPGTQLGKGRQWLDYEELSLGTRRIIHLLTALIVDGNSLMLVEHPEDGIHRGLVRKLIELLRVNAGPGQILLSTHSSAVVNQMKNEELRLVTIDRGKTNVRSLSPKETTAVAHFIEEEGTLSEFLESVED